MLLHKRKGEDETDWPGLWLLCGGKMEKGETPEETIRREIQEELGYELKNPELLVIQDFETNGIAYGKRYVFKELHDPLQPIVSLENFTLAWANEEELRKLQTDRAVLEIAALLTTALEVPA